MSPTKLEKPTFISADEVRRKNEAHMLLLFVSCHLYRCLCLPICSLLVCVFVSAASTARERDRVRERELR